MRLVVRTNANGTLGHLARCRHLGQLLSAEGWDVCYLLDREPDFKADWLNDIVWQGLYNEHNIEFSDETDDALRCLHVLNMSKPDFVVVDDYRLAVGWEQCIAASGYKILAIDDLRREHAADILLEPKPISAPDKRSHCENTVLLSGPRYLLLDPLFSAFAQRRRSKVFTVLMSLGGGGDLRILHDCIVCMMKMVDGVSSALAKGGFTKLIVKPVIGPMAENAERIRKLAACYPETIVPLDKPDNMAIHFQQANLFVGAAGTSIYEAAVSKLPAVTFSLAQNQCNDFTDLEPIGHYLHINEMPADSEESLAGLIIELIQQHKRHQQLRDTADVVVDGKGASRVAVLLNEPGAVRTLGSMQESIANDDESAIGTAQTANDNANLFAVSRCTDRDINRYLHARNLPTNRCNMTTNAVIDPLTHYHWWFRTKRQSYSVQYQGQVSLYIWHEVVQSASCDVLVGGWFAANDQVDLMCVVSALDWQLAKTDVTCQGIPWIAIIKKTNRFVYKMNQRAGFRDATPGSVYYRAICEYFCDSSPDDFHYVFREEQSVKPIENLL